MITFVFGTRPEIIKLSPVIALCKERGLEFQLIHTGQHYSENMDKVFFDELELPQPDVNLGVGSGSHGKQTGIMLEKLEKLFMSKDPGVVVVQGDTNSVFAGALTASKMHFPVAHVEAGLRSFDREMPEELNRIMTDHISTYLFPPTEASRELLAKEGIVDGVYVVGNTIVDAVHRNRELAKAKSKIMGELSLNEKGYCLVTLHRAENVDKREVLRGILDGLNAVIKEVQVPLVWPIHPRTKKRLEEFGLEAPDNVKLLDPLGYIDFLTLQSNAKLILTDSGGLQEEACILGVPCVTIRTSTERPETLDVGSNVLAGVSSEGILEGARKMLSVDAKWSNPFGDGKASDRILDTIKE